MDRPRRFARLLTLAAALVVVGSGAFAWILWGGDPDRALRRAWRDSASRESLVIEWPRPGTRYPRDLAAPTFRWRRGVTDARGWLVEVTDAAGRRLASRRSHAAQWTPDAQTWSTLRAAGLDGALRLTVIAHGEDPTLPQAGAAVDFATSPDPVAAPVFFRHVTLPFEYAVKNPDSIRWCVGDLGADATPRTVLSGMNACGNCHSFTADGRTLAMDVDYANDKGNYAIFDLAPQVDLNADKIISWSDYRRGEGGATFGLLAQVSPDGRHVVCTVKDRSVFMPVDDLAYSQLFFPIRGILCVYDREEERFFALPGADDPDLVQSNPAWSPDGEWVYFARAEAVDDEEILAGTSALVPQSVALRFSRDREPFAFDLYRVPFNGGEGGEPEPVPGASDNGRSNYFPKISPDGKWLVFCQADNYMLLQPDSELYIMPAAGGEPRRLACNTGEMNSWHSWSPNSRWLVWSTKVEGPYTGLALAHVDAGGRSGPPILLERLQADGYACNIPEFFAAPATALGRIHENFVGDYHHLCRGMLFLEGWDSPAAAFRFFTLAVADNPDNVEAHRMLGYLHVQRREFLPALKHYRRVAELAPDAPENHREVVWMLLFLERREDAVALSLELQERWPDNAALKSDHAYIALLAGDRDTARRQAERAIALSDEAYHARMVLGKVALAEDRPEEAEACFRRALAVPADRRRTTALSITEELLFYRPLDAEILNKLKLLLAARPGSGRVLQMLARYHLQREQLREALRYLEAMRDAGLGAGWVEKKMVEVRRRLRGP